MYARFLQLPRKISLEPLNVKNRKEGMNWVGGARSRVKYFNNNRVQRDYFECKRLASKVQRLQPSRKNNGSLDLYFFNNTVSGDLKPGSTSELAKSVKLTKLEARYDVPRVRELELPMSPIGRPSSVLDIMNVTDVSADDQELSLYGPEPVKSQPRMSTQKLPHLIKREPSSRRHTMKNCTADESLLSYGMDLSTTAESIIPPPTKKLKPEVSAPPKSTNPYSKHKPTASTAAKTYSIDKALNAATYDGSLAPTVFKPPTIATASHKSGRVTAHQLAYEESRGRKGENKAAAFHEINSGVSKKHQAQHHQHDIAGRGGTRKRKSVVAYDQDAMLEFHYEEQDHGGKKHKSKHQGAPSHITAKENFGISFGGDESSSTAAVPSPTEQASLPIASASNAAECVWNSGTVQCCSVSSVGMSENPFPRITTVEPSRGKEASSYADLDESVLHPIVGKAKHKAVAPQRPELSESVLRPTCICGPKIQQRDIEISRDQDDDMTVFEESIFGPIQKKKGKPSLEARGIIAPLKAYKQTVSKKSSKPSAFELMMKSLERERLRERDGDCDKRKDCCRREKKLNRGERNDAPALKNLEWKNFINGVNAKPAHRDQFNEQSTVSDSNQSHDEQNIQGSERVQSMCSTTATNPKVSFHNISAFEELICLEEENAAHLISQDFPISPADWTEDPILTRNREKESRDHRPTNGFNSSQDSTEATKGSSWSDSNSNSMPNCSSGLNNSQAMHQPSPSMKEQHCTSTDDEGFKGEQKQLSFSQDVRTPIQSSCVCVTDDGQARSTCNSQTGFDASKSASQTIQESDRADKSTQWSPNYNSVTATKKSSSTDTQPASQGNAESGATKSTETQTEMTVATQTHLTSIEDGLCEPRATETLTEQMVQTDEIGHWARDARAVDKLKKEVERLERELGMAQSTLVWQSLMMTLLQS